MGGRRKGVVDGEGAEIRRRDDIACMSIGVWRNVVMEDTHFIEI